VLKCALDDYNKKLWRKQAELMAEFAIKECSDMLPGAHY
jgi:hypothetical protein